MVDPVALLTGEVNTGVKVVPTFTVIDVVVVQPLLFVKVIVVEPVVNPLTTPVLETVATAGFEETHGLIVDAVVVEVNVIVFPAPTVVAPEITGIGVTVIA